MHRFAALALLLLSVSSSTAAASTGVLPVDSTAMGKEAPRIRAAIVEVVKDVLRGRYVDLAEDPVLKKPTTAEAAKAGAVCLQQPECLPGVVGRNGVDEVVHLLVEPTGARDPWARVTLTLLDPTGKKTFVATQTLTTQRTNELKGLLLRAFAPARFVGRVDFLGLEPGDTVWVDDVVAQSPLNLRPGPHRARVAHVDGTLTRFDFDVAYDEKNEIVVPARGNTVAIAPTIVGSAAVVAGVVGVGVGVFMHGFYGTALERLDAVERCDDDVAQCDRVRSELQGGQTLALVGGLAGGVVAAAGVVTLVAGLAPAFLPPTDEGP